MRPDRSDTPADLRVSLLGPLEVRVDAQVRRLSGQKRAAVLALLALRVGRVVPAEVLVDGLWGEHAPAGAANTLQSHVSHVRRALGPAGAALVSRPPGYLLDLPADRVDVHRFAARAAAGRAALAAGRAPQAAAELTSALSLWRGPALADLAGLDFADREAVFWEEARLTALEDRMEAELALGHHDQLVAGLGQLVAEHPLRERPAGQLMLALYRSGRQADALAVFQHLRRRLGDELGLEPGRPVQALEQAILLQEPSLDLVPAAVDPVAPAARPAPAEADPLPRVLARIRARGELVGRGPLLERVTGLVAAGDQALVLLTGEPGIGKSRLAAEVARRRVEAGTLVLYGRCDRDGGAPFHPIADAVADLAERDPSAGRQLDLGGGPARFLRDEAAPDPSEAGPVDRRQAFDELAQGLLDVAAGRSVLVVVDDLQWADRATVALLRHLVLGRWSGRFAVVAPCRSTEDWSPWLRALVDQAAGDEQLVTVPLDALPPDAAAELAGTLGLAIDAAALVSATGGNPLLIRQLGRDALETGSTEGRWGSLEQVLAARLAAVPAGTGDLLEVAALAGSRFSLGVVAAAAGVERVEALELVEEARRARLVDTSGGPGQYAFAHDVVRDFLIERIAPARRVGRHAALAAALEEAAGPAAAIAHHHLAAAPILGHRKVAARVAAAADRARSRLAFEDAVALYRTALDLLAADQGTGTEDWDRTMLGLAEALFDVGDPPEARVVVLAVADAARRRGDASALARAAIAYQGRWIPTTAGSDDNHRTLLADARTLLGGDGSPALRARLDARLALADFHRGGDEADFTARAAVAVDEARSSGDARALAEALTARHTTATLIEPPRRRVARCLELRDAALRAGNAETLATSYAEAAVDHLAAGDLGRARADHARFEAHVAATGSATLRWRQGVLAATLALAEGRFDAAEALSNAAFELGVALHQDDGAFAWAAQSFVSAWSRHGAASVASAAADLSARHPATPAWAVAHALGLADAGRTQEAQRLLGPVAADRYAAVPRDLLWLAALTTAAETVARCRDEAAATVLVELLQPYAGQLAIVGAGVAVLGPVDRVLGRLHALRGDTTAALRSLRAALELVGSDFAPWRAITLVTRAEAARDLGLPAEGIAADAAEAARLAEELGMPRIAREAQALLATGPGGPVEPSGPSHYARPT